jgi:hypothetical protein
MKGLVAALLGVAVTNSMAWGADMPVKAPNLPADQVSPATAPPWNVTVSSEIRYFSWQSNHGFPARFSLENSGSGAELYIPFAAQIVGRPNDNFKIEFLARGGWVWARQSTAGLTGEVATTTDTVANGTVTYLGLNAIQPFVSVSTNLPTGRSALFGVAANARMDPDLVDIASFGEGFNLGPTVGFSVPINSSLIVTSSAGYTWRGVYSRDNSLAAMELDPTVQSATNIHPGNSYTVTSAIGYQANRVAASIIGTISQDTQTVENGVPLYRAGRRYVVSGTLSYTWPEAGVTTLAASAAHSNRNDVLFAGASALVTEAMNTNSNLYRVGIQHLIPVGRVTFGPTASYLHRDHNGYDSSTLQFVPAKDRWAAGGLVRVAATDTLTFNARVERVWVHENENPAQDGQQFSVLLGGLVLANPSPAVSSNGWQFAVGATARF